MQQEHIKTTGVVLRYIDVKDNDRIIVLLTRELGLIKVYAAGARSRNHQAGVASNPLVESEWILKEGREELYFFKEASILSQNLHLRTNLDALQAACDSIKATEKGIVEGDPAPEIYDLLMLFLQHFSDAISPKSVKAVYQLKLLLYQGLLGEEDPPELLELSELRSLAALLTLQLPQHHEEAIQSLFHERFLLI